MRVCLPHVTRKETGPCHNSPSIALKVTASKTFGRRPARYDRSQGNLSYITHLANLHDHDIFQSCEFLGVSVTSFSLFLFLLSYQIYFLIAFLFFLGVEVTKNRRYSPPTSCDFPTGHRSLASFPLLSRRKYASYHDTHATRLHKSQPWPLFVLSPLLFLALALLLRSHLHPLLLQRVLLLL
jgi:hypothetical protein